MTQNRQRSSYLKWKQ